MKKICLIVLIASLTSSTSCLAMDETLDLSFPKSGFLSKVDLLTKVTQKQNLKTLNLAGQREVDDDFIGKLVQQPTTVAHLVTLDLSDTSVTKNALETLLKSANVATRRDLPQYSERYERPSSQLGMAPVNVRK